MRGVGYFICVFGFVDEVLRRHTPLPHSHRIERSDPPALFEMKCRRRPHLVHLVILPFGTENLYEPKERLLITQKRGIDEVRLEDIELRNANSAQNTAAKKRAGWENVDSDYLFANSLGSLVLSAQ